MNQMRHCPNETARKDLHNLFYEGIHRAAFYDKK
jgi:hypothetical protein